MHVRTSSSLPPGLRLRLATPLLLIFGSLIIDQSGSHLALRLLAAGTRSTQLSDDVTLQLDVHEQRGRNPRFSFHTTEILQRPAPRATSTSTKPSLSLITSGFL
jgi:hypothetical protein